MLIRCPIFVVSRFFIFFLNPRSNASLFNLSLLLHFVYRGSFLSGGFVDMLEEWYKHSVAFCKCNIFSIKSRVWSFIVNMIKSVNEISQA